MGKRALVLTLLASLIIVALAGTAFGLISSVIQDSPADPSFTNDPTPSFLFTASGDAETMNCTLYLNDSAKATNGSVLNGIQTELVPGSSVPDGVYVWTVGCTDGDGTVFGGSGRTITVDAGLPTITLDNLASDTSLGDLQMPINLTGTVSDDVSGIQSVTLYLDGASTVAADYATQPLWWHVWNPNDGVYNVTFNACDYAGNCANSTVAENVAVDVTKCGDSFAANVTLVEDLDCGGASDGLDLNADGITLDCDGHAIIGGGGNHNGVYSSGDRSNLTIRNCSITGFGAGINLDNSAGHLITANNISSNYISYLSGVHLYLVGLSGVIGNLFFDNDIGVHLDDSDNNDIRSNTLELLSALPGYMAEGHGVKLTGGSGSRNNTIAGNTIRNHCSDCWDDVGPGDVSGCAGDFISGYAGVYVDSGSSGNNLSDNYFQGDDNGLWIAADGTILGNNNFSASYEQGIGGPGSGTVWNLTARNRAVDSNLTINGNISFGQDGVLELAGSSSLTLNGLLLDLTGNVTSLDSRTQAVVSGAEAGFNFTDEDSNITLVLGSDLTATMAVFAESPTASGATAALSALKGVDIQLDSTAAASLSWAMIRIFYDDSELTASGGGGHGGGRGGGHGGFRGGADIDESTLRIYYYNSTAGDWQLEPNQGVDAAGNYVWANVTHFSLFGAFGSGPTTSTTIAPAGSSFIPPTAARSFSGSEPATFVLRADDPVVFRVGAESHSARITAIYSDRVTMKIASEPAYVDLYLGSTQNVDVNDDGTSDLALTLKSVTSSTATVLFERAGAPATTTTAPAATTTTTVTPASRPSAEKRPETTSTVPFAAASPVLTAKAPSEAGLGTAMIALVVISLGFVYYVAEREK